MRYIIGLALTAFGMLLIIKTEWFLSNFGHSSWAEAKFAMSGGTRTLYKLIGLILIIIAFMLITNLLGSFLSATVLKLFIRS